MRHGGRFGLPRSATARSRRSTVPETLQAIDLLTQEHDLLEMYCNSIVKNKRIGIYDGAYKCVELATGRRWVRDEAGVGRVVA